MPRIHCGSSRDVFFFDRPTLCKMVWMHPLDQLLLSLSDGHQRRVVWRVVSSPVARHEKAESERGDDTSAISSEHLLEEVDHFHLFLGFTNNRGVSLSSESTFMFLVAFIWSFLLVGCFSDSLYLLKDPALGKRKRIPHQPPPAA